MGVIYKARHSRLDRWVALKVMVGGEFASVDFKQRFRTEAQAAAALEHPNIIPIYEVGEEDGQPYFSMKLVEAGTLTSWRLAKEGRIQKEREESGELSRGVLGEQSKGPEDRERRAYETPLQRLRDIAEVVVKLSRAVQFAHDRGVLHRDLKPNNVLVDSAGELFLTDFGLAKLVEKGGSITKTIAVLGTPSYMAPEQARGDTRQITTAADVYGLGAILYELIAGRPPFMGQSPLEIIKQVLEREPSAPSVVAMKNGVGFTTAATRYEARDLDTICLKCLEKEPSRRYASARALGEDLERWLNHEPLHARQASVLERVGKWVRRKPAWAGLIATVLLSLVALGVGSVLFTAQVMDARTAAEQANRELSRNLFVREWLDAESLLDEGKISSALGWFARAARQHPGDIAVQTRLLSLLTERDFALPAHRPFIHGSPVNNAALLADDHFLATAGEDGAVRVWPLDSDGQPFILSNRFENPAVGLVPGANLILVNDARSLSLWQLHGLVSSVSFSHAVNGRLPISADGRRAGIYGRVSGLHLWDTAELKPVGPSFEEITVYPQVAGFTPDGKYVLGRDSAEQLLAWEISSGRLVWRLPPLASRGKGIVQAGVLPGGKTVLVSSWVSATGGELSGWTFEPAASNAPASIASSEGWLLPTRSTITTWCIFRNGKELFVGDSEGHLGIVSLSTHQLQTLNAEHDGIVRWIGLSRDGNQIATASGDGTARLWDVRMKSPEPLVISNEVSAWDAKFTPDSRRFVFTGNGAIEIHDAHSAALLRRLPMDQFVMHVDVSADSRRLVACGAKGLVKVWDAETGTPLFEDLAGDEEAQYVEFSRDGARFLVVSRRGTVVVRETETGHQIGPTLTNSLSAVSAHFALDGGSLVVSCDNGNVEFWALPEGHLLSRAPWHKDVIWTTCFSPDGKLLLTASRDRTAALWEVGSGRRIREFRHEQQVYNAAFSPDGRRIVTGDASHKAHVWDADSGRRLFSLPPHPGGVWYGEFSPDGKVLLTGDDAGNARLWEASSGLPLSGWVHNGLSLKRTHLSPDGRMALSAAEDGTVRLWPVLLAPQPTPPWLPELAEAIAGRHLRDDGAPESVPPERWQALKTSLSAQTGDDFYSRWCRWFFVERMQDKPPVFMP